MGPVNEEERWVLMTRTRLRGCGLFLDPELEGGFRVIWPLSPVTET